MPFIAMASHSKSKSRTTALVVVCAPRIVPTATSTCMGSPSRKSTPRENCKTSSRIRDGVRVPVIQQRATTCDLCRSIDGRPSCVYACPHDAAFRMSGPGADADRQPIDLDEVQGEPLHGTKPRHPSGCTTHCPFIALLRPRVIRLSRYPARKPTLRPVPIPIAYSRRICHDPDLLAFLGV